VICKVSRFIAISSCGRYNISALFWLLPICKYWNDHIRDVTGKELKNMSENNTHKSFSPKDHIPEDVREHMRAARDEMRKSMEGMLPPGFIEHRRAARKEMLLAFRGLLDHAIERIDERVAKSQ
jgi:hypothetical protein